MNLAEVNHIMAIPTKSFHHIQMYMHFTLSLSHDAVNVASIKMCFKI